MLHSLFDSRRYLIPFRSVLLPQIFTDTLVIGGGVAGLSAAMTAREHGDVIVLGKGGLEVNNTAWAQGGIAAVLDAGDRVDGHVADTLEAGAGLCDEGIVREVCMAGPGAIEELLRLGFRADRSGDGALELGMEGGHHARRILHSSGDATGAELMRVLGGLARGAEHVRVFEHCFALDLLTENGGPGGKCLGAITYHKKYGLQIIWARATVLAAGGAGVVWRETTNPPAATADGHAMAYRAGAAMADLAFMQFHPTTLYVAGAERLLISEAVRGEGAHLVDGEGVRFMEGEHPLADLAPRDIVASAIHRRLSHSETSQVFLDARGVERFAERFPGIAGRLEQFDLDASRDLIPVHPGAHYMIGGVRTDGEGRTSVPGLYAVGECACSGLHGANRLASNSLLEGLVLGARAGRACEEAGGGNGVSPARIVSEIPPSSRGELDLADVRSSLRSVMWRHAGILRTGSRLEDLTEMCGFWARYTMDKIFDVPFGWETQNMLLVSALIARSAVWRRESRGAHRREDYPEQDASFAVHDLWTRGAKDPEVAAVGGGVVS